MDGHKDEPAKLVGYVFDLNVTLGEGQVLTVRGNLALGATKEEMGLEFDKLLDVSDRLKARYKIAEKQNLIAADQTMIAAMEADLKQLDATATPDKRLNVNERNNREAMVRNIRHLKSRVGGYEQDVEALKKQAA